MKLNLKRNHTTCTVDRCSDNSNFRALNNEVMFFLLSKMGNNLARHRSENCRKFVPANRRPHNWKMYSSKLQAESYRRRHWPDLIHMISQNSLTWYWFLICLVIIFGQSLIHSEAEIPSKKNCNTWVMIPFQMIPKPLNIHVPGKSMPLELSNNMLKLKCKT